MDFFAARVIPVGEWHIVPYAAMGRNTTLHLTGGQQAGAVGTVSGGVDLLKGIEIRACVGPGYEEEGAEELMECD